MTEDMEARVVAVFKRHMANPEGTAIRVEGYKSSSRYYEFLEVKCLADGGYLDLVEKSLGMLNDEEFIKTFKKVSMKMGVQDFEGTRSKLIASFNKSLQAKSEIKSHGSFVVDGDYHLQRKPSSPDALYLVSLKKVQTASAPVGEEAKPEKDKDLMYKCLPIGQYLAMLKLEDEKFSDIRLVKDVTNKG